MNKLILLFVLIFSFFSCAQKEENIALKDSKEFQYKINLEYADIKTSPLTKEDFKKFSSLNFFEINEELYVNADFIRTPNEESFEMLTTTSRLAIYVKYGEAHFVIKDKKYKLNIYQSLSLKDDEEYKDYLFLPFTDLTNNKESYAGGRYIDLSLNDIKDKKIIVNFNNAYNPYCAYNHKYSCPIPPSENHLEAKINAGVKKFH